MMFFDPVPKNIIKNIFLSFWLYKKKIKEEFTMDSPGYILNEVNKGIKMGMDERSV